MGKGAFGKQRQSVCLPLVGPREGIKVSGKKQHLTEAGLLMEGATVRERWRTFDFLDP